MTLLPGDLTPGQPVPNVPRVTRFDPFDTEFGHLEYNVHLARLAGLSPMESLQAVTRNAARLLGLEAHVGTLEAGKAADLLVLEGDPLADAEQLTRVAAVFKAGVRIR